MNSKIPIPKLNIKFPGGLDINSLGTILDQLRNPCLVLDAANKIILQVNNELITITAFTRQELCGAKVDGLIKSFNLLNKSRQINSVEIIRKNKPSIRYNLDSIPLNGSSRWLLIMLTNPKMINQKQSDVNFFMQSTLDLSFNSEGLSIDEYLEKVINKLNLVYKSKYICIYLSNEPFQILMKRTTIELAPIFPGEISFSDVSSLKEVDIWKPGKRVMNEIQRSGRMNGIELLIQVPLLINEKVNGLIVLGNMNEITDESEYDQLPLFARIISAMLERKLKDLSLQTQSNQQDLRNLLLDHLLRILTWGRF